MAILYNCTSNIQLNVKFFLINIKSILKVNVSKVLTIASYICDGRELQSFFKALKSCSGVNSFLNIFSPFDLVIPTLKTKNTSYHV